MRAYVVKKATSRHSALPGKAPVCQAVHGKDKEAEHTDLLSGGGWNMNQLNQPLLLEMKLSLADGNTNNPLHLIQDLKTSLLPATPSHPEKNKKIPMNVTFISLLQCHFNCFTDLTDRQFNTGQ